MATQTKYGSIAGSFSGDAQALHPPEPSVEMKFNEIA